MNPPAATYLPEGVTSAEVIENMVAESSDWNEIDRHMEKLEKAKRLKETLSSE